MIPANTAPRTKVVVRCHFDGEHLPPLRKGDVYVVAQMDVVDDGDIAVELEEMMIAHKKDWPHTSFWKRLRGITLNYMYPRETFDLAVLPEAITNALKATKVSA